MKSVLGVLAIIIGVTLLVNVRAQNGVVPQPSPTPTPTPKPTPTPTPLPDGLQIIVDAQADGIGWSYGPALVQTGGADYCFVCSGGAVPGSWDSIRAVSSGDSGQTWNQPSIALTVQPGPAGNYSACDPSIIQWSDGNWYLFFSNAFNFGAAGPQTVVCVARSATLAGPFLTYTQRGTWEWQPADPKILIQPLNPIANHYGAGEQIVVYKDGLVWMWYIDDTDPSGPGIYGLVSADPVTWSPTPSAKTDLPYADPDDVKWDAGMNAFVFLQTVGKLSETPYWQTSLSSDGQHWTVPAKLRDLPHFAGNGGWLRDPAGHGLGSNNFIGFAAPYNFVDALSWGQWNLYGTRVSPIHSF